MDKKLIVLLLAFALLLHGCCGAIPSNGTNSTPTANKLCPTGVKNCYENYYLSVIYPDNWTVHEEDISKKVYLFGPGEIDSRPNCEITVGEPHVEWSFSEYINSIKIANNLVPGLTVVSEGNRTINGLQAYQVFYTTDNNTLQVVYMFKIYPYTISCGAPQATFSTYEPQFESIITSFKTL